MPKTKQIPLICMQYVFCIHRRMPAKNAKTKCVSGKCQKKFLDSTPPKFVLNIRNFLDISTCWNCWFDVANMKILWPLNDFMNYFKQLPLLFILCLFFFPLLSHVACVFNQTNPNMMTYLRMLTDKRILFEIYISSLVELVSHKLTKYCWDESAMYVHICIDILKCKGLIQGN